MQIVMESGQFSNSGDQFEFDLMTLPIEVCLKILKYVENQAQLIKQAELDSLKATQARGEMAGVSQSSHLQQHRQTMSD